MFTGIVEEKGRIAGITPLADAAKLIIEAAEVMADCHLGDSISVNGVCLTVAEQSPTTFTVDVMAETLNRSSLGGLGVGSMVNLERAARLDTRLGGHLVQGHVDGTGVIEVIEPADHWTFVRVRLPMTLARYVVEKGSIAVDGVSLTVVDVSPGSFSVSLIPTTLAHTTLGNREVGDVVNLEVDVIAKYVEKLMGGYGA